MRSIDNPYDEERAGGDLDQEELLEILELRETLEGCKNPSEAQEVLNQARRTREEILARLAAAFRECNLDKAHHEIDRLKFYETVIEAAETRHESLT